VKRSLRQTPASSIQLTCTAPLLFGFVTSPLTRYPISQSSFPPAAPSCCTLRLPPSQAARQTEHRPFKRLLPCSCCVLSLVCFSPDRCGTTRAAYRTTFDNHLIEVALFVSSSIGACVCYACVCLTPVVRHASNLFRLALPSPHLGFDSGYCHRPPQQLINRKPQPCFRNVLFAPLRPPGKRRQ
jgi:hypothetical protein